MPDRLQMPIATLLSAWTDRPTLMPMSVTRDWAPKPSATPFATPPNSATPEDRVMLFCVGLQCLSRWAPRKTIPPE
eukprot:919899-Lingulodinium_polyedra.AAC.1